MTKPYERVRAVGQKDGSKVVMEQFSMRIRMDDMDVCRKIAKEETKKNGYPVGVMAIIRKFISEGVARYEK